MKEQRYVEGSGNVFADLNLPKPEDLLVKAELVAKIIQETERRHLTQSQAAVLLGIDQPKISALKQGKLSGFSIERLIRFLLLLGRDVEITVKQRPKSRSAARLRVA
jgi:predicted XRE-type DNA-binding protein